MVKLNIINIAMAKRTNRVYLILIVLLSVACSQRQPMQTDDVVEKLQSMGDVVWALNVGGAEYLAQDGILFEADTASETAYLPKVNAIQDQTPFKTYRTGGLKLSQKMANGNYAITLHFVEPSDLPVGTRVFNILAEAKLVESGFDVRRLRDGNAKAGLSHTVVGVEVFDGALDLELEAVKGEPLLSAVVVRKALPLDDKWQLVWNDEFDYQGAPDASKWTHDIWPAAKVNREDQQYTDSLENVRVVDGKLVIEAHKLAGDGAQYSSGRIHSLGKGDIHYGRVDIRAKLPAGQGTWSALWMLPSDPFKYSSTCDEDEDWQGSDSCNAWPNSGEIDIMEHVGYDMNRVHGTVHTKAYYWVNGQQRKASVNALNVADEFHTYAMEWSPERIDIFFDDVRYFTYLNQGEGWQAWPFDHPYHVILNLAIGGDWGRAGGPIDDSIFPVKMEVDYVRFYKLADTVSRVSR